MSERKKIKDFLIFYIPERVIIFPIHDYLPILANNIIRDLNDWELIKEGKLLTQKEKYFKYFLEKELDKILQGFIILFRDLNVKIYTIYKDSELPNEYLEYFTNINDFGKIVKNIIKKKTKYFKEIKNPNLFKQTEGLYKEIKIGKPTGEDIEFFIKHLKK
jgi:hypothetical protein